MSMNCQLLEELTAGALARNDRAARMLPVTKIYAPGGDLRPWRHATLERAL